MKLTFSVVFFFSSLIAGIVQAQTVDVVGGATSVALDTDTLSAAAGLDLSGVSGDVIVPGTLPDSVAFGINSRDAASLPTTFSYDPADFLGTFSGTIEHTGSVFFNMDTIEVGNFTIAFDAARVGNLGGAGSGFFVESTTGLAATLFDVVDIDLGNLVADETDLIIPADLAVSPEFGQFLLDNQFSSMNLAGAVVGSALVEASVPEPSSMVLMAIGLFAAIQCVRKPKQG